MQMDEIQKYRFVLNQQNQQKIMNSWLKNVKNFCAPLGGGVPKNHLCITICFA